MAETSCALTSLYPHSLHYDSFSHHYDLTVPDFTIDVVHVGRPRYVAVQVLDTQDGPVLIDTGPGSTLPNLRRGLTEHGIGVSDLHAVLLSHIHLDHAGATGSLARENPALRIFVHERGAAHMIDPTKLIASATRIYGSRMDELWGEFLPIPSDRTTIIHGGETLTLGGRRFEVAHTPGHAVHHVSYFESATGTAYVGDTGGIMVPALSYPTPVSPPPDFNLEDWLSSVDRIAAWKPRRIFRTHFGFTDDPSGELRTLRAGIENWATTAKALLERQELSDEERADQFHRYVMEWLAGKATSEAIAEYADFSDFRASWYGLARYWRKRATQSQ